MAVMLCGDFLLLLTASTERISKVVLDLELGIFPSWVKMCCRIRPNKINDSYSCMRTLNDALLCIHQNCSINHKYRRELYTCFFVNIGHVQHQINYAI